MKRNIPINNENQYYEKCVIANIMIVYFLACGSYCLLIHKFVDICVSVYVSVDHNITNTCSY